MNFGSVLIVDDNPTNLKLAFNMLRFAGFEVIQAIDAERMALASGLGVPTRSLVDACADAGYTSVEAALTGSVYDALQAGEPISRVKAPPSLDHRYLHEDVGWGLVQWVHLASMANVAAPTMEAVVALAGTLNGIDYRNDGLTLERMGVSGLDADAIAPWTFGAGALMRNLGARGLLR